MNCAINSSAAKKRGVRRIHNRIDIELGNVAAKDLDSIISLSLQAVSLIMTKLE
jgi:hypothetical protein